MKIKKTEKAISLSVSFFHRIGRDAYIDWMFGVLAAVVLAAVLAVVAYVSYGGASIEKISTSASQKTSRKPLFDEQALNKVMKMLDERANERKRLEDGYSGPVDPSI